MSHAKPPGNLEGKTVLIAPTNTQFAEDIKRALTTWGAKVEILPSMALNETSIIRIGGILKSRPEKLDALLVLNSRHKNRNGPTIAIALKNQFEDMPVILCDYYKHTAKEDLTRARVTYLDFEKLTPDQIAQNVTKAVLQLGNGGMEEEAATEAEAAPTGRKILSKGLF